MGSQDDIKGRFAVESPFSISLTPMCEGRDPSRFSPQARHVALPRDAEADGSAVVDVLGAAEPLGGALRGGATQRVPWQEPAVPAKATKDL